MTHCCVPLCTSDRRKKLGLSFHEFPVHKDQRQSWLKAISRKDFMPNDTSCSSVVCSLHFLDSDYHQSGSSSRRRLKPGAVPSIFPAYPSYLQPQPRRKRRKLERTLADVPPKGTNAPNGEARKENASPSLTSSTYSQQCSAESMVHPCSVTAQESPVHTEGLGGHAQVVDSSAQTSIDLLPRNPCDARAINRLRVQLFRKNDTVRRLQRENENLKKRLS